MESNLIMKVGGELHIKKSVLRNLIMRSLDSESSDAIGYLLDVPHSGNYVSVDKISDLLKASVGREATSKLLYSCVCDEEDLPDIMLDRAGSIEAEIARARLKMPDGGAPLKQVVHNQSYQAPQWNSPSSSRDKDVVMPAARAKRATEAAAKADRY